MPYTTLPLKASSSLRHLLITCICLIISICPAQSLTAELVSPIRLAHLNSNQILVSDFASHSIVTLDQRTLKTMRTFTIAGRPLGLAYSRGKIYVGNATTGTVEVYNPAGKWLYDLGAGKGLIKNPTDMVIDEKAGYLFVVDGHDKNIKLYDTRGALLRQIGVNILVNPTAIVLDNINFRILVSDYGNPLNSGAAKVFIFDYEGGLLGSLSGADSRNGFSRPQGIGLNKQGHVLIADALLSQILVIDPDTGQRLKALGQFGSQPGDLQLPLDLLVLPVSQDVWVSNNRLRRIEVYPQGGLVQ